MNLWRSEAPETGSTDRPLLQKEYLSASYQDISVRIKKKVKNLNHRHGPDSLILLKFRYLCDVRI